MPHLRQLADKVSISALSKLGQISVPGGFPPLMAGQSARRGMPTHTPPFAETHFAVCGVAPFLALNPSLPVRACTLPVRACTLRVHAA